MKFFIHIYAHVKIHFGLLNSNNSYKIYLNNIFHTNHLCFEGISTNHFMFNSLSTIINQYKINSYKKYLNNIFHTNHLCFEGINTNHFMFNSLSTIINQHKINSIKTSFCLHTTKHNTNFYWFLNHQTTFL